jgi:hypothetical protein
VSFTKAVPRVCRASFQEFSRAVTLSAGIGKLDLSTTLGVGSSANLLTAFSNASAVSIVVPALTSNPSS